MRQCGRVNDEKVFTRPILETRLFFFGLILQNHTRCNLKKRIYNIGESAGHGKISFVKLSRWVYKYESILRIDCNCLIKQTVHSIPG